MKNWLHHMMWTQSQECGGHLGVFWGMPPFFSIRVNTNIT